MAPDTMSIRLHLRLIRVLGVLVDSPSELVVEVAATRGWSRCPHCGFTTRAVHDRRARKVRDLPVGGRRTTLVWQRRRFWCGNCGERHLEEHPAFDGKITVRLARALVADAKVMSIRAVARRHRLGWHLIMGLVTVWADLVAEHRRRRRCRVLLIDETSMRRRHRYVTVLQNGETGEVLAIVGHRDRQAVVGFLAEQGHAWRRHVRVVVTDGSASYTAAVQAMLPQARHVLDRFHVVRWFAVGLIEMRRELQRRPADDTPPAFHPELHRARYLLLRRVHRLDGDAAVRLVALLQAHPELEAGWAALQWLYRCYDNDDEIGGRAALTKFRELHDTGRIPAFDRIVEIIDRWEHEIFDFHHPAVAGMSNGRLEGTNNKLQVLRRVAHGFTNRANYQARGILTCGPMT
jgi:transposase